MGLLQPVGPRKQGVPLHTIYFHILSLLTNFDLRPFDLDLIDPVTLNNDELACLVQAWSDLETFCFNRRRRDDYQDDAQSYIRELGLCGWEEP